MTSLKNELIGTWELLSYIEVPIDGTDSIFPMGKNPTGLLIFSSDDYMSLQISANPRLPYSTNDRFTASQDELVSGFNTYVAYCGQYEINSRTGIVSYHITNSLYPNFDNTTLRRKATFEADVLYLKSLDPILSNNSLVNSYLTWKKIEKGISISNRLDALQSDNNLLSEL